MVAIINNCVDGVVPHSYMVTLTLPDHSDLGRPLDTKEKLSFLQDWVRQYTHEDTTNTAPTTAASSTPTPSHARATNYFTAIMFGVAVEAGDKVRHACNTPRAPMYSSTPVPAPSVPVSLYRRVLSIPYSHTSSDRPHLHTAIRSHMLTHMHACPLTGRLAHGQGRCRLLD
jgi:hypothetical protein